MKNPFRSQSTAAARLKQLQDKLGETRIRLAQAEKTAADLSFDACFVPEQKAEHDKALAEAEQYRKDIVRLEQALPKAEAEELEERRAIAKALELKKTEANCKLLDEGPALFDELDRLLAQGAAIVRRIDDWADRANRPFSVRELVRIYGLARHGYIDNRGNPFGVTRKDVEAMGRVVRDWVVEKQNELRGIEQPEPERAPPDTRHLRAFVGVQPWAPEHSKLSPLPQYKHPAATRYIAGIDDHKTALEVLRQTHKGKASA